MADAHVLTPEQLRELDAAYVPVEPFDAWADLAPAGDVWDRYVERYEAARAGASRETLDAALRDVARGASFDSGAIEGLYAGDRGITHTVMTQAATWEAYVAQERGPEVVDFVKAHLDGYEMALDVATRRAPVTEAWIRQVHAVVCAPQRTYGVTTQVGRQQHELVKGAYRTAPNHVLQPDGTPFAYAPVDRVGPEMARLVDQLRRPELEAAHPAAQAAYAHHAFVRIHPFPDGNGRVSRILASIPLLRAVSIPLVVYADQRVEYLAALAAADRGDRRTFAGFVGDRAIDSVALLADLTAASRRGLARDRLVAALESTSQAADELLAAAVTRVLHAVVAEWRYAFHALGLPAAVTLRDRTFLGGIGAPVGYLSLASARSVAALQVDAGTARDSDHVDVRVFVAVDEDVAHRLRVSATSTSAALDLRLGDVHPAVTNAARLRIRAWTNRLVAEQVERLAAMKAE